MNSSISLKEINKFFNLKLKKIHITGASIDTRSLKKGNIFFALEGNNFDGNDFIKRAESKGASVAIVKRIDHSSKLIQIKVNNTQKALRELARFYRSLLQTKIIGITGSVGKTGTKDAISKLLNNKNSVFCSKKSYNNHIGLPIELLNMPKNSKYGFFELGMNHPGEISKLTKILQPEIAIILNIENVHIGNFHSLKEIAKAKSEIFSATKSVKHLILNKDTNYFTFIKDLANKHKIKHVYDLSTNENSSAYFCKIHEKKNTISLSASVLQNKKIDFNIRKDQHNLMGNILAIIICFQIIGINPNVIKGFMNVSFSPGRGNVIKKYFNGFKQIVYDFTYNASPVSMKANLEMFAKLNDNNQTYIIGDMNELGKASKKYHREILNYLLKLKYKKIIFVGPIFFSLRNVIKKKNIFFFQNINEVIYKIDKILNYNCNLFMKGSNSIKLNKLISFMGQTRK